MRTLNPEYQSKPVVAVDFDGTLVFNRYPIISNPNIDLIAFILDHRQQYTWVLWTCRSGSQLKMATDWLKDKYGLVFDYVNENTLQNIDTYGDCRKIWADYYIDDRNCKINECIKELEKCLI